MSHAKRVVWRAIGVPFAAIAALALSTEAWSQVAEIIVTTRKREENLQEVPVAVEAITAADIEAKGLVDLGALVSQSASVILDQGFAPQDQRIVIRGLSPTRGRQNVAVLVDDIDISSETLGVTSGGSLLINPRLFDIERVEIVKGPQNAQYGRSAFAGAINFITKKPGDVLDAKIGTDFGTDGQQQVSGSISGPITDSLGGGVTGVLWSHDGYYRNSITGQNIGDEEGLAFSGTLVWAATDNFKATLRGERTDDEYGVTPQVNGIYPDGDGAAGLGQAPFLNDSSRQQLNHLFTLPTEANTDPDGVPDGIIDGIGCDVAADCPLTRVTSQVAVLGVKGEVPDGDTLVPRMSEDPRTCDEGYPGVLEGCSDYGGTEREINRVTLTLDWDVGPVSLKSLSHYANAETRQDEGSEDQSASVGTAVGEVHIFNDTDLLSQEFRVVSNGEGPFRWLAGALYWSEDGETHDGSNTCIDYTGFPAFSGNCGQYFRNIVDTGALPLGATIPLEDPNAVPLNPARWLRDTEHYSVYAHVDWEFVESWTLSVEARQTWEKTEVSGPNFSTGIWDPSGTFNFSAFPSNCVSLGPPFTDFIPCPQLGPGTIDLAGDGNFVTQVSGLATGDTRDDFFAPKATIAWQAADNQNYYFSWAQAYKPEGLQSFTGGAGTFDPVSSQFKQEKLVVWELGGKTDWLDNRVRLNGALFFQDFKNKQVSSQVDTNGDGILEPRTVNAGQAEVWGAEVDLLWVPNDNMTFSASYAWLDTEYTEYKSITRGAGQIAYVGNCRVVPTGVSPSQTACEVDYSGNQLEGAPKHTIIGTGTFQYPMTEGIDWLLGGDVEYQSERFTKDNNQLILPSYYQINLRAGLSADNWDLIAYVDNATDDDTVKQGFSDGDLPAFQATNLFMDKATVILPDQRQYGLRFNLRFGN